MLKSGIYKIESKSSCKVYIGSSLNVESRIRSHIALLKRNKHVNERLQQHWNEYGESDLVFSVVEYVNKNILHIRESYFINKYNSFVNGFNLTLQTNRLLNNKIRPSNTPILEVHYSLLSVENFSHTHAIVHAYMLSKFTESDNRSEYYCESQQSISDNLVISKRTLIKVLRDLEKESLIKPKQIRIGRSSCTSYEVIKPVLS